jgi:hypothetical protein
MGNAEQYVRPPLVAREAPSPGVALWRFRAVALVLLALLAAGVVALFLHFSNITAEDPGLGGAGGLGPPSVSAVS